MVWYYIYHVMGLGTQDRAVPFTPLPEVTPLVSVLCCSGLRCVSEYMAFIS